MIEGGPATYQNCSSSYKKNCSKTISGTSMVSIAMTHTTKVAISTTETILDSLKTAGEILRVANNKNDVLDFTIRIFLRLGFDRVRIWLVDEDRKEFFGAKASYMRDKEFRQFRGSLALKFSNQENERTFYQQGPIISRTNPLLKNVLHDKSVEEAWEFPLLSGKKILGFIGLDNAPSKRKVNLKELSRTVTPFVNHVALTLHRVITDEILKRKNRELTNAIAAATRELAEKNKTLERLSLCDALTNLPNRRDFDARLKIEFKKANSKQPLTLAMVDIDFFKQVNDTHGHLVGDEIITRVATMLADKVHTPYVARFAGDEFVALIPGVRAHMANNKLEVIRKRIVRETGQTVSIGLASYPAPGIVAPLDLIRRADDALYHAKHTGRNRVVSAENPKERVVPMRERKSALATIETRGTTVADYVQELEVLSEVSEKLQHALDAPSIAQRVTAILHQRFGLESTRLYIINPTTKSLECVYAVGIEKKVWPTLSRSTDDTKSVSAVSAATRRIIDIPSIEACEKIGLQRRMVKGQAVIAIPLMAKRNQVVGVIVADYKTGSQHFGPQDHTFFLALGRHIALALEEAKLFSTVKSWNRDLKRDVATATRKLRDYSNSLEQKVAENKNLREDERRMHYEMVAALIASMESKDSYTRGHSARVAHYAAVLGKKVGLKNQKLSNLRYGALLHDIGKLSVDQDILNKRTALTDEEVGILGRHPVIGYRITSSIKFLQEPSIFIKHHHERWDGKGYPDKLKGDAIPVESRIINIADSFDAMVTRRSYGRQMSIKDAIAEFRLGSGTQFDPMLVEAFVKTLQSGEMKIISQE